MGFLNFFKKDNSISGFLSGRPSRQSPPKDSGWYRFFNKDSKKYDYTGISNNLSRRFKEHIKGGKFLEDKHIFEWKEISKGVKNPLDKLRLKEIQKIKKYVPTFNGNKGGGGRKPNDPSGFLIEFGVKLVKNLVKSFLK